MAQHLISIFVDSISPPSTTVHPGDSVQFLLKRPDAVTVEFVSSAGSPFAQSAIPLDGSSSATSQSSPTVQSNASGHYGFNVVPGTGVPVEPDPPAGTLSGDIDVTPDGPRI